MTMFGGGLTDRFLDLPGTDIAAPVGDIVLFGADCATPYATVGAYCAGGPAAIRVGAGSYSGDVRRVNFDLGGPIFPPDVQVSDAGDLPVRADDPAGNRAMIMAATQAILGAGGVPVVLGGDDSVPIPMLSAFADHGPITILQIDAHIDWRDAVEGEPLGLSSTMRRASEMAHVERIIQVGARGVGSASMTELEAARAWGAHLFPAQELHDGTAMSQALELVPEGAQVVICLDWDALDPAIMPSVIAPTAGGLSYAQALNLIRGVAQRGRIAGFNLVEFMPASDLHGIGARTAAQLLTSALGLIALQSVDGR
jgi:agmatinase